MGLFSRKQRTESPWAAHADQQAQVVRKETACAAEHKRLLDSGESTDRAADRYMVEEHEGNARVAAANVRDFRDLADGR